MDLCGRRHKFCGKEKDECSCGVYYVPKPTLHNIFSYSIRYFTQHFEQKFILITKNPTQHKSVLD